MKPLFFILTALLLSNFAKAQFVFTKLNLPTLSFSNYEYTTNRWVVKNGKVYFTCTTNQYGAELWETDGTPAGTKIVKDIYHDSWSGVTTPNSTFQDVADLREFDGKMYFSANDSTHGAELWYSNGTAAGTQMLIDLMPGRFRGCYFGQNTIYNGRLYFAGDSNQYQGKEPWVTDGTAQGTYLLKDINPGILQLTNSSNPRDYHQNFGLLFFIANTTNTTTALYQTNGTTIGTVPVLTDTMPSNIAYSKAPVFKNNTYYISKGQLWTYDGSFAGMQLLYDYSKPSGFKGITTMDGAVEYKGKLYFSASDSTNGFELWTTDGTTAGTTMLKDIYPGINSSYCSNFCIHDSLLYFAATDTLGTELWVTDGTSSGTHMVADILGGKKGSEPHTFTSAHNRLYFIALNNFGYKFLYYTDGTAAGTHRLEQPSAVNDSLHALGPKRPLSFIPTHAGYLIADKSIYVYARYDTTWFNLWKIEDTTGKGTDTSAGIRTANITEQLSVEIYPNPARTYLSVKTSVAFKHGRVTITDMAGRTVQTANMQQGTETQITLNDIAPGMYMADVWVDDKRSTQKLIVQ